MNILIHTIIFWGLWKLGLFPRSLELQELAVSSLQGEEGTRESELVNWRGGHRRHGVKEGNVKRNLQWEESQLYERGGLVTIKGFKIRASKEKGVDKLTTPCFSLSSGGWGWHNEVQV